MNMLTFTINENIETPIYLQLYNYIKSEIQSGNIPFDTKLPSKRKLSEHLNISQNTIQSAYDQLIEEGYVIPKARRGFFVCKLENIIKLQVSQEISLPEDAANKKHVKYDFSYNGVDMENFPFGIWRKITKDVINEYDKELLKIGDSQGNAKLRRSIAEYLRQSRGVNCTFEDIIVSSGTEYLFQILIQMFNRSSVYGLENPGYEKLNLLFKSNRAKFKPIKIDKSGMILEDIIKSGANILCITPAHQFPSGSIMPINRRIQILNWANEHENRYIIEDDYDSEFKYSGKPIPALQGLDTNGKVIYMGAFSKSLSPSLRISYMVLPPKLMTKYKENLSYIFCPVPIIEQKVLYNFIQKGYFERHLNKMRNVYKKKREILVNSISKLKGNIEIIGSDAGLHVLLKVNNGMKEKELISSALKAGIKVYGISKYYVDKSYIKEEPLILLGYATMTEANIINAVELLKESWEIK